MQIYRRKSRKQFFRPLPPPDPPPPPPPPNEAGRGIAYPRSIFTPPEVLYLKPRRNFPLVIQDEKTVSSSARNPYSDSLTSPSSTFDLFPGTRFHFRWTPWEEPVFTKRATQSSSASSARLFIPSFRQPSRPSPPGEEILALVFPRQSTKDPDSLVPYFASLPSSSFFPAEFRLPQYLGPQPTIQRRQVPFLFWHKYLLPYLHLHGRPNSSLPPPPFQLLPLQVIPASRKSRDRLDRLPPPGFAFRSPLPWTGLQPGIPVSVRRPRNNREPFPWLHHPAFLPSGSWRRSTGELESSRITLYPRLPLPPPSSHPFPFQALTFTSRSRLPYPQPAVFLAQFRTAFVSLDFLPSWHVSLRTSPIQESDGVSHLFHRQHNWLEGWMHHPALPSKPWLRPWILTQDSYAAALLRPPLRPYLFLPYHQFHLFQSRQPRPDPLSSIPLIPAFLSARIASCPDSIQDSLFFPSLPSRLPVPPVIFSTLVADLILTGPALLASIHVTPGT